MTRQEFLDSLRRTLNREMDSAVVDGHIRYYDDYIRQQIAAGKTEEEVMAELGDPRLIAKTLLEVEEVEEQQENTGGYEEKSPYGEDSYGEASYGENTYGDPQNTGTRGYGRTFYPKRWHVILAAVLFFVILFSVLRLAIVISWKLLPVILVVLLVVWIKRQI